MDEDEDEKEIERTSPSSDHHHHQIIIIRSSSSSSDHQTDLSFIDTLLTQFSGKLSVTGLSGLMDGWMDVWTSMVWCCQRSIKDETLLWRKLRKIPATKVMTPVQQDHLGSQVCSPDHSCCYRFESFYSWLLFSIMYSNTSNTNDTNTENILIL